MTKALFDDLNGLKEECAWLRSEGEKWTTAVQAACEFDGVSQTSESMTKQSITAVAHLDCRVVQKLE